MGLPPSVKVGDRISVVAPAGPVKPELLAEGCAILRSWGLEPVVHPQVHLREVYLAGSDEMRAQALVEAFDDPSTTAVVCAKGGYGCARLLVSLPLDRLGPHNLSGKRFFGFSDATALHRLMQTAVPGHVSFHAPMPATALFTEGTDASQLALRDSLFQEELAAACPPLQGRCLQMGRAVKTAGCVRGRLVGGNMTLVTSLLGTPWQLDLKGAILLLEDVDEAAYRVDRMWTHLLAATGGAVALEQLAGLVLGDFSNMLKPEEREELGERAFEGVETEDTVAWFWLHQLKLPASLPVLAGLPIGHIKDNRVAPIGALVEMDLNGASLRVVQ